ncbi:hypothetical protein C8R48DRAFT_167539 [Suillus tomentosus]|nr:hypothetical protein C8R48DRAFT_167539 [Suillus tomentosus]
MPLSLQFMEDVWVRRSFSAAGHTLLVYDYLLTFSEEFVYIWKSPWTAIKIMFLLSRYGNLIGQTVIRLEEAGLLAHDSQKFCQGFAIFSTCFMLVSVESIHILVLLRAWAIWGTRRRVTNIFAWSYVVYIVVLMASSVWGLYTGNSRSLCTVFIFIRKNGFASVVHFQFLRVAQVCVATGPSR